MSWLEEDEHGIRPPFQNSSNPRDGEPSPTQTDPDALHRWQEERIARKLRGEYESAVLNLNELITSNMSTSMRITSVRVEGAKTTQNTFLDWLISPLLPSYAPSSNKPLEKAETLDSVLHTTRRIAARLEHTDLFRSVDASLERSRGVFARPGDVDILFKTKEKGRLMMKTSTEFGNQEGSASLSGRVRNLFGLGATLEGNVSLGTKTRRAVYTSLSFPLTPSLRTKGELSAYLLERDNTSYASSHEGTRGIKAVVRTGGRHTLHEVGYEAVQRHIRDLLPTASLSIREEAGHSFKSSFSHTFTHDTRDDKISPTRGSYLRLFNELAGFGPESVKFAKTEAHLQIGRRLLEGVNVSLSTRGGLLFPLNASGRTSLPDRFQLGGPTNVRMFRANSMGPRDNGDSIGGELYYALGLSVLSSIPKKPHWPLKAHLFVNAGRLEKLDQSRPLSANLQNSLRTPSISAGVGLMYRFDPIRLEVNFGVPLAAARSDGWRRGFQVGMGLEFL